jgi:hypothetical protein
MSAQMQQFVSQVISLDAPVEGWNAFDSLDAMPATAAIVLDNIIPGTGNCRTREGYLEYYDLGTGEPVETVASLDNGVDSKLVAASAGGVWDITDTAPAVQASVVEEVAPPGTFTSDRWQTENFRKADELGVMIMCNGVDNAQVFGDPGDTGTYTLSDLVDTDTVGTDFIGCVAFKGRMFYWKDNDNAFYYSQAGSYQGVLKKYDLGGFAQKGGKLVIVDTWTQQDSGDGKDDFIVFIFSTGEILLYQGDDPETVGYWEMVGRYFTAEPMSIRGSTKYGSDLIIMTRDGYVNLASIVQQGRTSDVPQFSRLIHQAIKDRTDLYYNNFGWCVELFQKEGLMVFNVPLSTETFEQHVLNTSTMRWCRFNSLNVNCIEVHKERLFAGAQDGTVHALLETTSDNGNPIYFDCLYAFSYYGNPGYQKHMTSAQVLSTHREPWKIQLSGYADFQSPDLASVEFPESGQQANWSIDPPAPPSPVGSYWDLDFWATETAPFSTKGWQNVTAFGYSIALLVRFALLNEKVRWRSTSIRYHTVGAH